MPIVKYITSAIQDRKAKKIKTDRPTYEIPKEIGQNQAMFQAAANTSRIPGQSVAENNIGANNASSMNAAMQAGGSSSDILAAMSGINQNTNNQYNNLAMQGVEMQMQNKDRLAQSNETMADYKQQEFDYNKNQPYELAVMRKRALETAANANRDSANNDTHEAGMSMLSFTGGGKK
jgi:hypothetical protein